MGAMLSDLEGALDVEVTRAGGATGEATTVIESVPRTRRLLPSRRVSIAGILLVLAAAGIALAIAALTGEEKKGKPAEPGAPASGAAIELEAAEDFDPEGDDEEHSEEAAQAIDGNPDTPWVTETYTTGPGLDLSGKSGVGLIVEANEPVAAREMTIVSATGGWSGEVYGAADGPPDDLAGWGQPIGQITDASDEETVALDATAESRYYLLWITDLAEGEDGFVVEIGEIELTG
jgi:serine/threonine-protein kinase